MTPAPSQPAKSFAARVCGDVVKLMGSYGLAVVVLFWLLVLTVLGTWEQKDIGLFEVQRRYFTAFFVLHDFGWFKLPLPGVYLLLIIFTMNLVTGTLLRVRKRLDNIGLLIVHCGMLILLFAALVTHYFAIEGQMTLAPGQSSNTFSSYNDWELLAVDLGPAGANGVHAQDAIEHIIALGDLTAIAGGMQHEIQAPALPFTISLVALWRNAAVQQKGPMFDVATPVVNGYYVQPLGLDKQNERNLPAGYFEIGGAGVQPQDVILSGDSPLPYVFTLAGRDWALALRHRTWEVPFTVQLKKFTREVHPGTEVAKNFQSDILKIENGQAFPVTIRMNEPLRSGGYTFFQASFAKNDQADGGFTSTFAVVKNPSDQWPLYACVVITFGLLLHFAMKLMKHLSRTASARGGAALGAAPAARSLIFIGLLALSVAAGSALRAQTPAAAPEASATTDSVQQAPPAWPSDVIDAFSRWPIQDEGRIKPLSTFARFKLVKLSGRSALVTPDGRRLEPMAWLLDTIFYPPLAREYHAIRVDNPAVLHLIGIENIDTRTSVSFSLLAAHDDALTRAAVQAGGIEETSRTLVQQQTLNLYDQYNDLAHLLHALDFTEYRVEAPVADRVRGWIGVRGAGAIDYSAMVPASLLLLNKFGNASNSNDADRTSESLATVNTVLADLDHLASLSTSFTIIPPQTKPDAEEWLSPGTMLREVVTGGGVLPKPELALLREFENLPNAAGMQGMLAPAGRTFGEHLRAAAGTRIQPWRLDLEIFFYRMQFFYYSLVLFLLSFLCIACSWLVPKGSRADRIFGRVLPPLVVVSWLLLIAGIVVRCIIRGRPPVSTLYETTLFVPAVAITVALVAEWINRKRIALAAASILGCAGLFLANTFELRDGSDTMTSLVAVLNSNFWLSTHVVCVAIGYSASALAIGLAHIFIFAKLFGAKKNEPDFYRDITRITYGVICFGTLFSFTGTVLGGIWANYSWGRFWGWDPKENGALAIIIWNLIILHSRMGGYVRELGINMMAVFGGILLSASWWGVNLLGVGLHSYGFTSGIAQWLFSYWGFEVIVLALAACIPLLERRRKPVPAPKPS